MKLSIHCEFGTFLDDTLRDKFIHRLRSEAMQNKLSVEADLTFTRAIEIALSMESGARKVQGQNFSQMQGQAVQITDHHSCYKYGQQDHIPVTVSFQE